MIAAEHPTPGSRPAPSTIRRIAGLPGPAAAATPRATLCCLAPCATPTPSSRPCAPGREPAFSRHRAPDNRQSLRVLRAALSPCGRPAWQADGESVGVADQKTRSSLLGKEPELENTIPAQN